MWLAFVVVIFVRSVIAANVSEVDVLILGAGITGITAGNHFQRNNLTNFLILEAQDYIGGRIKQAHVGNVTVGEGANWVHFVEDEDENPILTLANEINLEKYMNNEEDIVVK
jgi:polyamine oxidase